MGFPSDYWNATPPTLSRLERLGWVSAMDSNGRTIWIADAHRDDGKRFVVHADEKLTAFLELDSAIRVAERNCFSTGGGSRVNA